MSKYCIYLDRPMSSTASGEEMLTGCMIFGVHHECKGCPNLVEMGDATYSASSAVVNENHDYLHNQMECLDNE